MFRYAQMKDGPSASRAKLSGDKGSPGKRSPVNSEGIPAVYGDESLKVIQE